MSLNRAELVRRLEALERRVGTDPAVATDAERFASFGDALVFHCDSCGDVNVPADVWDVSRRLPEGSYQGLFSVTFHPVEDASPEEDKAGWREAEDQAYALVQVLDALPSLIQLLRQDAEEGDLLPAVDPVDLVLGPRQVWMDPDADPDQENGIYEVTVQDPPGCEVSPVSSRACERGTKGCIVSHTGDT